MATLRRRALDHDADATRRATRALVRRYEASRALRCGGPAHTYLRDAEALEDGIPEAVLREVFASRGAEPLLDATTTDEIADAGRTVWERRARGQ